MFMGWDIEARLHTVIVIAVRDERVPLVALAMRDKCKKSKGNLNRRFYQNVKGHFG